MSPQEPNPGKHNFLSVCKVVGFLLKLKIRRTVDFSEIKYPNKTKINVTEEQSRFANNSIISNRLNFLYINNL